MCPEPAAAQTAPTQPEHHEQSKPGSQGVHLFFIKAAKCDFNLYSNDCNPEGETIWTGVGSSFYYNTVQSIGLCHTPPVKIPVEVNN